MLMNIQVSHVEISYLIILCHFLSPSDIHFLE
jgi:hypothetical protein